MENKERRLVSGKGQFVDDLEFAGMASLVFVGSPYAHAKILRIDVNKALETVGVLTIITGKEIVELTNPLPVQADLKGPGWIWRLPKVYALAVARVRWYGEPVAAVVAEDENTAREAADLIEIEYEPLPFVNDVVEAMKPGSPLLYSEWESNVQAHVKFDFGDVDSAFAEADRVIKVSWREGRASGFPIEGRGCVASYDKIMESLTVWGSFQTPFTAKHIFAETLGMPEVKVKIVSVDIGGAFGNKLHTWKGQVVALASVLTGRPVKWFELLREWIVTGPHQRDVVWEGEVAIKNDGRVLGLKANVIIDLGVEGTNRGLGTMSIIPACCSVPNAYHWKGMHVEGYGIVTNKSFYCAYRGYGKDKGIKFIERVMDQVAREVGITPEEVRFINFIQPDEFPYRQINNYTYDSGNYPAVLNKALELAVVKYCRERQRELTQQGKYIGVGMAFTIEPAGIAAPNTLFGGMTEANVKIMPDGTVEVNSDWTDLGQGAEESNAIIVSDILGCKIEDIVVPPVTSDWIGMGPLSSRGAVYIASAVAKAAKMIREKILTCASVFLKEPRENIDIADGIIYSVDDPEKRLTYKELAQRVYFFPGPRAFPKEVLLKHDHLLDVTTTWYSPNTAETGSTYTTFCSSADVAVVEVDTQTGVTKILKYVHVHDAGKIISQEIVDGQIHGGVVQGIGEALYEKLVYSQNGLLLSDSYSDYLMPTATDSPDIIVGHLETPSPFTELGSKGMGEAPIIGSKAAIIAAIEDALTPFNIRVSNSPATREKVWKWIRDSQKKSNNEVT